MNILRIAVQLLLGCVLLWGVHCQATDLDEKNFFSVSTNPYDGAQTGVLIMEGQLFSSIPDVQEVGFLFGATPDLDIRTSSRLNAARIGVAPSTNAVIFTAKTEITPDQTIYYQAFAIEGERTVLGEVKAFTFGLNFTDIATPDRVFNDETLVLGNIQGVKSLKNEVSRFGHVFSALNTTPEVDSLYCDTTFIGKTNNDTSFQSRLSNLKLNTTYYVRGYAYINGKIYHSKTVQKFQTLDGWKRRNNLTHLNEASGAVLNGKAYFGLGCGRETCLQPEIALDIWEFDPTAANGLGDYKTVTKLNEPNRVRTNAVMFTIPGNDTLYMVFGEYWMIGEMFPIADAAFNKFIPSENKWRMASLPTDMRRRASPISFVLNGKAYIGTGRAFVDTDELYRDDFWEYSPQTGNWRKVASGPHLARRESFSFSVNNTGYMGGGIKGTQILNDFWAFTPPTSPADTGSWKQVGFLPGIPRYQAFSFAIGGKGYFGCGTNDFKGNLNDVWEYNPSASPDQAWRPCTPFIGGERREMLAFSIGSKGYAGLGVNKVLQNQAFVPRTYADWWEYEPRK